MVMVWDRWSWTLGLKIVGVVGHDHPSPRIEHLCWVPRMSLVMRTRLCKMWVCMCVCVCVCVCTCVCVCVCDFLYVSLWVCEFLFENVCVCMCVSAYVHVHVGARAFVCYFRILFIWCVTRNDLHARGRMRIPCETCPGFEPGLRGQRSDDITIRRIISSFIFRRKICLRTLRDADCV